MSDCLEDRLTRFVLRSEHLVFEGHAVTDGALASVPERLPLGGGEATAEVECGAVGETDDETAEKVVGVLARLSRATLGKPKFVLLLRVEVAF